MDTQAHFYTESGFPALHEQIAVFFLNFNPRYFIRQNNPSICLIDIMIKTEESLEQLLLFVLLFLKSIYLTHPYARFFTRFH